MSRIFGYIGGATLAIGLIALTYVHPDKNAVWAAILGAGLLGAALSQP